MPRCPSRLRPYLKGESKKQKSKAWLPLPPPLVLVLGEVNILMVDDVLSSAASFDQNQRLAYELVDRLGFVLLF